MDAKVFEIQCQGNNQKMSAMRIQMQVWLWKNVVFLWSGAAGPFHSRYGVWRVCVGHLQYGPSERMHWLGCNASLMKN